MQLVLFEEHMMGSSGGLETTTEKKRKTRVVLKALCDIPFKHNDDMVENFVLQGLCDFLNHTVLCVCIYRSLG